MASWNRKKTTPSTEPGSARTAIQNSVELITRYEDMLRAEWEWQNPPIAVDASLLPAPKEAIKNAYWIMLSVEEDSEGLAMMRKCFVTLAQFQHGVGPEPIRTPKDEKEFVRKATRLAFASPLSGPRTSELGPRRSGCATTTKSDPIGAWA